MTFTEIQDRLAERLGIPSTATASLARIGRQINDVYREVTTSIGLDLSRRVPGVVAETTMGVQTLTFTGIEKIERLIDDTSGSIRIIPEVTFEQIQNINPATSDAIRRYAVESWTGTTVTIRMDILPQTEFELKADGYTTVSTLSGSDVPAFPVSFHDIIIDGVLAEEYYKQEKHQLGDRSQARFEKRLSDLRMWRAKSISLDIRQAETRISTIGGSGSAGGAGSGGSVSYTQTGLITFDRDPLAPFAVTASSAVVPNLDADMVDGVHAAEFALLAGRSGGQTLKGGTGSGEDLTLMSTNHATKGQIITADRVDITRTVTDDQAVLLQQSTSAEATASALRVLAYSPSIELLDKDAVQNWHIGIDDNDSDAFVVGSGYGPGGGVVPAIRIDKTTYRVLFNYGQLGFPAVQNASADANTLDDYEEGTWTPSLGGNTTYTDRFGFYTKIGRMVVAHCFVHVNAIGTGSTGIISGLTFNSAQVTPGTVGFFANAAGNFVFLSCYANVANGITITGLTAAANGTSNPAVFFADNASIYVSVTYFV